jgi:hypothetical protein
VSTVSMSENDDHGHGAAPTATLAPTSASSYEYGFRQVPARADEVVVRTMTEYRAPLWAQVPPPASSYVPFGEVPVGPSTTRPRKRWFWPVVSSAVGLVALLGGGVAGFAIGHNVGGGSSQTTTNGGTGTGTGGTGTGNGFPQGGFGGGTGTQGGTGGTGGFGTQGGTGGTGTGGTGTDGGTGSGSTSSGSGTSS